MSLDRPAGSPHSVDRYQYLIRTSRSVQQKKAAHVGHLATTFIKQITSLKYWKFMISIDVDMNDATFSGPEFRLHATCDLTRSLGLDHHG